MNESKFVAEKRPRWDAFRRAVARMESGKQEAPVSPVVAPPANPIFPVSGAPAAAAVPQWLQEPTLREMPGEFRQLCADLSIAQHRMYSLGLIEELNELVIRANKVLHRTGAPGAAAFVRFLLKTFPRSVQAEWRLFVFCSLAFWLPFGLMMVAAHHDPVWVETVLGPDGMSSMDAMYGGDASLSEGIEDEFGSRFAMFGHYIWNNVGIDFRMFAGGLLAGVGTLFFLLFNGVYIGAAAGYCTVACNAEKFWYFVVGHSAPELTGMVICGVAGMRVGLGWLKPGRLSRVAALGEAGKKAIPLLLGGAMLTAIAAPVEAFWSAYEIPKTIKLTFGLGFWVLLYVYLFFCGREKGVRHEA